MEGGDAGQIVSQVAGCITAAAVVEAVEDEREVLLHVDIERRHGPVTLGMFGFLFHAEHLSVGVFLDDTRALKFLDRRLVVAHDTGCAFLLGEIHEALEREIEEVVGGGD